MHLLVLQLERIIFKQKEATGDRIPKYEFSQPGYGGQLYIKTGTVPIQHLFCSVPTVSLMELPPLPLKGWIVLDSLGTTTEVQV